MAKNTAMPWNVMRVRGGQELNVHEMLTRDPVLKVEGVEVFTPYEMKRQRLNRIMRKKRNTPRPYASPLIKGWVILRTHTPAAFARTLQLIEHKPMLHGYLIRHETPVQITNREITTWKAPDGMRQSDNRLMSYDPKRDSRKNLSKIYGQTAHHLPKLSEGEVVRMLSGPLTGIDMTVMKSTDADDLTALLSVTLFSGETRLEAPLTDIRKVG